MCLSASSNITNPFSDWNASFYFTIFSLTIFLTQSIDEQDSYTNGDSLTNSPYASYSSLLWKSQKSKSVRTLSSVKLSVSLNFSIVTLSKKSWKTFLSLLFNNLSSKTRSHSCLTMQEGINQTSFFLERLMHSGSSWTPSFVQHLKFPGILLITLEY